MSQPLLLLAQLQLVTSKLPSSEGLRLCRALSTARPTPQRPLPLDLGQHCSCQHSSSHVHLSLLHNIAAETVGVKQRLFTLLSEATEPVPSADLWDRAQVSAGKWFQYLLASCIWCHTFLCCQILTQWCGLKAKLLACQDEIFSLETLSDESQFVTAGPASYHNTIHHAYLSMGMAQLDVISRADGLQGELIACLQSDPNFCAGARSEQ